MKRLIIIGLFAPFPSHSRPPARRIAMNCLILMIRRYRLGMLFPFNTAPVPEYKSTGGIIKYSPARLSLPPQAHRPLPVP